MKDNTNKRASVGSQYIYLKDVKWTCEENNNRKI